MKILISDKQLKLKINNENFINKAKKILKNLDCFDGELSFLLLDDTEMSLLNKRYRGIHNTTNVLSFCMNEGVTSVQPQLLGDVVISLETVLRESINYAKPLEKYFDFIMIHGILHLFGFDHEKNKKESILMENETKRLLKLICFEKPVFKIEGE